MKNEKKYLDDESRMKAASVYDVLTKHDNWGRFP